MNTSFGSLQMSNKYRQTRPDPRRASLISLTRIRIVKKSHTKSSLRKPCAFCGRIRAWYRQSQLTWQRSGGGNSRPKVP